MDPLDWLVVGTIAFTVYTTSGLAGKHLHRFNNRRNVSGDMTGGDVVGRNNMATMQINGRTFTGSNISMQNGRIIVDGQDVTEDTGVDMKRILEVKIVGTVESVFCEKSLTVVGNITGYVDSKGAVNCDSVGGDVRAAGSVNCDDVKGNVSAGGSVNCDDVGGSVTSGGSVRHG